MARSFTDSEKKLTRSSLIEKGRKSFAEYGLKRTSIADLTKAVHIAQGSFYVFFNSKEELYFEIVEMEEEKIKDNLLNLLNSEKLTKSSFKKFMKRYYQLVHGNPLLENLIRNKEYENLMRKLPEQKKRKHLLNESRFLNSTIKRLQKEGNLKEVKSEVLIGLFHSLFLLHLHKEEIGNEIFPQIMELITNLLSEGLVLKD